MKKFITFLSLAAFIFIFNGSVFAQGVDTLPVSVATTTSVAAKDCAKVTNKADIKAAKDIRNTAIRSAKSIRNIALKSAKEIRNTAINSAQTLDKDAAKTAVRAAKDAYATSIRAAKDAYATAIRAAKDAYAVSVNQPARYTRDAALESAKSIRNAALESARYIRNAALESAGARWWWKINADQTAVTAAKDAYAIAVKAAKDAYAIAVKAAKDAYVIAEKVCNQSAPDNISTQQSSNLKSYENKTLNISFSYPKDWGNVSQEKNGTDHIALSVFKSSIIFLAADNGGESVARGAYWGDSAGFIDSQSYVDNLCDAKKTAQSCEIKTNSSGVQYAKVVEERSEFAVTPTIETNYYIYNPNSGFRGIILSTDRLKGKNIKDPESKLQKLVDSFYFTN